MASDWRSKAYRRQIESPLTLVRLGGIAGLVTDSVFAIGEASFARRLVGSTRPRLRQMALMVSGTRSQAVAIATLAALLYGATLSRHFTAASLEFVTEIETGDWQVMLHRHKMLIHPMGWLFYQLWQLAGWRAGALLPMQVFNALSGALTVGLFYWISARVTDSARVALLTAVGFAVSSGLWFYSTEAEFVTLPLAQGLLILGWLLSTGSKARHFPRRAIGLGISSGVAILTFFTGVFLVATVVLGLLLAERQSLKKRLTSALRYVVAVGLTVVPCYAFVLYFVYGIRSWQDLQQGQLYGGQGAGVLYGHPKLADLPLGFYGALKTLASFPVLGLDTHTATFLAQASWMARGGFAAYYACVSIAVVLPLLVAVAKWRELIARYRQPLAALAVWTVLYAGFAVYWVPKEPKFWLPVLVPWWLVVGMLMTSPSCRPFLLPDRGVKNLAQFPAPHLLVGALGALLLVLNAASVIPRRDITTGLEFWIAADVKRHTLSNDLIITTYPDWYISYFAQRETVSTLAQLLDTNGDKTLTLARLDEVVSRVRARGGRAFIAAPGPERPSGELGVLTLSVEDLKHFETIPAWSSLSQVFLEVAD